MLAQARIHPDACHWQTAHKNELDNPDTKKNIKWLPSDFRPPPEAIILLLMIYRYKSSAEGHIVQTEAH